MSNKIYFDASADATSSATWVCNPDSNLPAGSPYQYVMIQQVEEAKAGLLAYCAGDAWLYRLCPAHGAIGTTFLFDAKDLASRVGKEDVWKRRSISFESTKRNKIKVEAINAVVDGKVESAGNIELNIYPGDLSDFVVPEAIDWQNIAFLDGWKYREAVSIVNNFSGLASDKAGKAVWFRFQDSVLSLTSSEKGSSRGSTLICYEIECSASDRRLAVPGKYLTKSSQVFNQVNQIVISVDDLDEPTRIRFSGDAGWLDVPLKSEDEALELSKGAMALFYGEGPAITSQADRTYNLVSAYDSLRIQKPMNKSSRDDVVIEEIDNSLIFSKLSDANRYELSQVAAWDLAGGGEWKSLVVSFTHFSDALSCFSKYVSRCLKEAQENYMDEAFMLDEELENITPTQTTQLVTLQQKTLINAKGKDRWLLFIEHPDFKDCKMMVAATPQEFLQDYKEPD
jgi:hypothetical protein